MPLNNPFKPNAGHGLLYSDEMTVKVNEAETFEWTAEHTFQNNMYAQTVQPRLTSTYDLGTSTKLWRKIYASEIDALLFAKNTISLLGGWFWVPKDAGTLAADVSSTDTTIDFGKAMTAGHFVVMRAALKVEYIQVGTLVSGTRYNVTRNLDGSGANDWPAGTPFAVLGTSDDGRIELNAYDSPRINIVKQGETYNAQVEVARLGDLNGNWGYSAQTWGVALGEYASGKASITVDPTIGLRMRSHSTTKLLLKPDGDVFLGSDVSAPGTTHLSIFTNAQMYNGESVGDGDLLIGDNSSGKANILWDKSTGKLLFRGGTTPQVEIGTDGALSAGAGNAKLNASGLILNAANVSDYPNLPDTCKLQLYNATEGASVAEIGAYVFNSMAPYMNRVHFRSWSRVVGSDTYYPQLLLETINPSGSRTAFLDLYGGTDAGGIAVATGPVLGVQDALAVGLTSAQSLGLLSAGTISIVGGTYTSGRNHLEISATWNASAATFRAIYANITNTASHANSRLLDLQVGGTSKFSVDLSGNVTAGSYIIGSGVGCCAYHNAAQSVNNATNTVLALNSEETDTHNFHDTVTNNSRITIPSSLGGLYLVTGCAEFASNTTGMRSVHILKNGTTQLAIQRQGAVPTANTTVVSVATIVELAGGDYVELEVYQNSGGALDVRASSFSPRLAVARL